jgi:hypothetical protein
MSPWARLSLKERWGVAVLLALTIAFGVLVEIRSAYSHERKTDLSVYLQAAWAVRAGEDLYDVRTERDCYYDYPPLFAILMVPLAEAPAGSVHGGAISWGASVAIWYGLSVVFAVLAVHVLATALEQTSFQSRGWPADRARWWALRIFPVIICLPGIARTLALGQVDLLVLLLLCLTIAAALRQRSWRAGLWLSVAMAVKLIPAFLLLYPLWRRDLRWLAGTALGLLLGMGVIPAVVLGPGRAWEQQAKWVDVVVLPGIGRGTDRSREACLTAMNAVNSQSLLGILHNYEYPDRNRLPVGPSPLVRAWALGLACCLTGFTLLAAGWRRRHEPLSVAIFFGTLVTIMLLVSPVCHPHYFCHWLPLVTALVAWDIQRRGQRSLGVGMCIFLFVGLIANLLTSIPGLALLRDRGLATAVGLSLWALGTLVLWKLKSTYAADSRFALAGIPEYNAVASRKAS